MKTKAEGDWLNDILVPESFRGDVKTLVEENKDLFAQTDAELEHTDTVRMKLDTGKHPPVNPSSAMFINSMNTGGAPDKPQGITRNPKSPL